MKFDVRHSSFARDRLDRPVRDLRISVTDRCNLRCTYCMPKERYGDKYVFLPREALLTFEEIVRVAAASARLGVTKLRITGGEPLLRKGLPDLVGMLRRISGIADLALTTNGLLLPEHAAALKASGLDRITVSLDSLDGGVSGAMNGMDVMPERVLAGIDAAKSAGFTGIKVNTVVQRGVNDHTAVDLAAYCKENGLTARFIEYMDVGTLNAWDRTQVVSSRELMARIDARFPLTPVGPGYRGEVAKRYAYRDGSGEVGFISSVSQPFCGDCTRLRLSSDGTLFTCLFATSGTDVKSWLRAGIEEEELLNRIGAIWRGRTDRYSEERAGAPRDADKVEMYHIGG